MKNSEGRSVRKGRPQQKKLGFGFRSTLFDRFFWEIESDKKNSRGKTKLDQTDFDEWQLTAEHGGRWSESKKEGCRGRSEREG